MPKVVFAKAPNDHVVIYRTPALLHGVPERSVTQGNTMLRIQAEASFEGVLRRISDEERDPTPWEGECLRAALLMMALEDYGTASDALKACDLVPEGFVTAKCGLCINDFSNLLATLKRTYASAISH